MIGNGLIRFRPFVLRKQDGGGMIDSAWREIKTKGHTILRDVITESALAGVKGLKAGVKGNKVNWKGGLEATKQGAKQAIKRKAIQQLQKVVSKRIRKDLFGP